MEYTKKEQILNCFEYDSDEYINIKEKLDESNEYTNLFYEYLKIRKELISNIIELEYKIEQNHYNFTYDDSNDFKNMINNIKIEIVNNQKKLQNKIQELIEMDDNALIKLLVIEKIDSDYEGYDNYLNYSSPFFSVDDFMQKMILPELTNEIKSFLRIEQNFSKYYNKIAYGSEEYEKLAKIDLSNDLVYKIIETFNKLNTNDVNDIKNKKDIIELEKYILDYKLNDGQDSKYIFNYFTN